MNSGSISLVVSGRLHEHLDSLRIFFLPSIQMTQEERHRPIPTRGHALDGILGVSKFAKPNSGAGDGREDFLSRGLAHLHLLSDLTPEDHAL